MLKTIFEHAARKGIIGSNPAKGARKLADQKRTLRLSVDQVRALGEAMHSEIGDNPTAIAAIRFMLMSGFVATRRYQSAASRFYQVAASSCPTQKAVHRSGPSAKPR